MSERTAGATMDSDLWNLGSTDPFESRGDNGNFVRGATHDSA